MGIGGDSLDTRAVATSYMGSVFLGLAVTFPLVVLPASASFHPLGFSVFSHALSFFMLAEAA